MGDETHEGEGRGHQHTCADNINALILFRGMIVMRFSSFPCWRSSFLTRLTSMTTLYNLEPAAISNAIALFRCSGGIDVKAAMSPLTLDWSKLAWGGV